MTEVAVKGGFTMHVPPGAAAYLTAEQAEHVSSGGCFTQALCLYVLRACLSVMDGQLVRSCAHKLSVERGCNTPAEFEQDSRIPAPARPACCDCLGVHHDEYYCTTNLHTDITCLGPCDCLQNHFASVQGSDPARHVRDILASPAGVLWYAQHGAVLKQHWVIRGPAVCINKQQYSVHQEVSRGGDLGQYRHGCRRLPRGLRRRRHCYGAKDDGRGDGDGEDSSLPHFEDAHFCGGRT